MSRKTPLDSEFAIVQDHMDESRYALMYVPKQKVLRVLRRHDLVKIMSDISNWLEEEETHPAAEEPGR
jgi:hypothetical protein